MLLKFIKKNKQIIFLVICFLLFVPSFYCNFWGIADLNAAYFEAKGDITDFKDYDPYPNMLVVGRLNEAKKNGIFSNAGLPGINYDKRAIPDSIVNNRFEENPRYYILYENIISEYYNFLEEKESSPDYCAYASQVGGQGILYSVMNIILPFGNKHNYSLIKLFNAMMVSLTFILFLGWICRNYGILASIITFTLLFLSPWLILLGSSLWWSIWGLYIPFLVMLLLLEERNKESSSLSEKRILFFLFLAVSCKCLFTGMEFITSALLALICPIVYYYCLEKKKIHEFIFFTFKAGVVALTAVLLNLIILFLQLQSVMGGSAPALSYLEFAFVRRTTFNDGSIPDNIVEIVIKRYLKEDAFYWGMFHSPYPIRYIYIVSIVLLLSVFFIFYSKLANKSKKYYSLGIATLFSILAPFSWFYIFVQHSYQHPFYDNMVWYLPFLLFGFLIIGVGVSLLFNKKVE